jgi:serine/threonine-protein kinase
VYAARHVRLDRPVAIKQLWPNLTSDTDARRRFAEEARVLASLDHPHIVRVYDYVERGACALVLEMVRGGSLSDLLEPSRPSVSTACRLVLGLLAGLEHAHQHGVVHRDVKPANLLFTEAGTLKVADFGVAKIIDGREYATAMVTETGCPVGTPAYMAPEQVDPWLGSASPATDVWAAGTILRELLPGGQPLEGARDRKDPAATRVATTLSCELPRALADVVAVATARLPADRYQSAAEFARHLERACQHSCSA